VLGVVDRLERRPAGVHLVDGGALVLLGPASPSLAGSRWAWARGERGGLLAPIDFAAHRAVCDLVRSLALDGVVDGVHDIADGGLALALGELAVASGTGAHVGGVGDHGALFGEGPSRVVVCAAAGRDEVLARAAAAGVPATVIGAAGGDRIVVEGLFDVSLADAVTAWRDRLPVALGVGVQGL
jgi:phosphoribosylformylglycinamidine synthase